MDCLCLFLLFLSEKLEFEQQNEIKDLKEQNAPLPLKENNRDT